MVDNKLVWTMDACGQMAGMDTINFQSKYGEWMNCPKCDYYTWISNSTLIGMCGRCGGLFKNG